MNTPIDDLKRRYIDALHAMQSGVAILIEKGDTQATPKHLRVGINSALVDSSALANLLIRKGVISEEEFWTALADGAEKEKLDYEERVSKLLGAKVSLG